MDLSNGYASNGNQEIAPSFLFGDRSHKRKALTLNGRPTGFGSPSILKKDLTVSSPGKNVRWSTNLVEEQLFSSKSPNTVTSPIGSSTPFALAPNVPSVGSKGPPLSSLDSNDFEPPQKLQRPDVTLDRREAAVSAINSNLNAFNSVPADSPDYWVTVFGFNAEDRDTIMNVFSRHGNIVSHNIPRLGNWIHLRYSSVLHAQQALKRDGSFVSDRLMVGVVKCTDKDVVSDTKLNPVGSRTTTMNNISDNISFDNPILQSTFKNAHNEEQTNGSYASFSDATSFNRSRFSALSRNGMRNLRASEVDVSLNNSARKDESFLTKFWSFVAPQ